MKGLAFTIAIVASGVTILSPQAAQAADPVGTIFVADAGANAIDVFAAGANGNVAPIRQISGALTELSDPGDVAVDASGDVFASNGNNTSIITEYAPGASGNVAPIRTISGSLTGLSEPEDISLAADGTLYVGNFNIASVEEFAPGASGNVAPLRKISGPLTGLGGNVDGVTADATGALYADNGGANSIEVYAPGANGNVAPIRTISGSLTGLGNPDDLKVAFGGQLFVSDGNNSLQVFPPSSSGNVAPTRSISGPLTELNGADDLAVDPVGTIYVTNYFGSSVDVFSPAANGNAPPVAKIAGALTTFVKPEGVALAPNGPHYYKNSPATVQYAKGKKVQVIAWGRLTLEPNPAVAAVTSCENASGGWIENPESGAAGIGATERFTSWDCSNAECPAGEVEIAPGVKVEKEFEVVSMPQSFPWPSELFYDSSYLLEGPPIRTQSTEVELELACMAHRIGPFSNSTANKNEFEPTRANIGEGGPKGAGVNEQAVFTPAHTLEGNPTALCKTTTAAETGGPKEQKPEAVNGTNLGNSQAKVSFAEGAGELSCAGGAFGGQTHESLKVMNFANSELINTH